ncbi:MAG: TetR/AcrR family transcriptional regulator [Caldilineaceae bacterium]|nr:TetR/AcrR family transcriptional regulator [Caldilineaceae bacterium]
MTNYYPTTFPLAMNLDELAAKPERADAQENRARILAAAEALFAQHGVNNVNMVDIARKAGVGQGTLYRRFANKGELCLALLDTQMRDFQEHTLTQLSIMGTEHQSYLAQLMWFIEAWVHFQAHHSLLLCAVSQDQPLDHHPYSPPFLWQRMTIHGLLRRAAEQHEVADDIDVPFSADALLALLQPDVLRLQQEVNGHSSAQVVAGLQRLVSGLQILSSDKTLAQRKQRMSG